MENSKQSTLERFRNFVQSSPEMIVILFLMIIYMFLGNYYSYSATFVGGFSTSGGSDPYYNLRVLDYIITNHHSLVYDYALNYPVGATNPRAPFYHWAIVFVAELLSPFLNAYTTAEVGLLEFDALVGAILIVPIYLIAAEAFGKKTGMVAAILYTLMPSNLSAGVLSDARIHTPELLFGFFTIYFFERAINIIEKDRLDISFHTITKLPSVIRNFVLENRLATIYGLLAGASLGGLMLAWQGYAYIEAIVLIYAFLQLIINLLLKRSLFYINYLIILLIGLGFLMGAYYYFNLSPTYSHTWFYPAFFLGLGVIVFGIFASFFSGRPWVLSLPAFVVIFGLIFIGVQLFDPHLLTTLLSGEGYFIKNRVYATIAEASSPPLGQYISGFGPAQFVLGMAGVAYLAYLFLKQRRDVVSFLLIFSLVSIYMSFAAARFNITAAPAYAILGAALLMYFADIMKIRAQVSKRETARTGIRRLKGGQNWLTALFTIALVVLLVVPSGFSTIASSIPANTAGNYNSQIYNDLPSFMRPAGYSASNASFVGASGFYITNGSDPLSQAFHWLSTQDSNLPMNKKPAFVSWWDYGFQEMQQGLHPTVADDFQHGYQIAGQVLLAQNQSQIISLFLARVLQASYLNNGSALTPAMFNALSEYLGTNEALTIKSFLQNPGGYSYLIAKNPSEYGKFIPGISASNAYFALVSGQLSTLYPDSVIVSLLSDLESITGYDIKYIGVPNGLMPLSGVNPGIFYAPTYLTDRPSYSANGEIVPYNYYQISAVLANGSTYPLNKMPSGAIPATYQITYNHDFYNTTIYKFLIGYSTYDTGNKTGIPGLTYGQTTYSVMPAHNMSHFEILYMGIPWNPYTDYQNHTSAWKIIPLQTAYYDHKHNIGTTYIFPPTNQLIYSENPIVGYFPGATVTGKVSMHGGQGVKGLYVTLFDQYGIPHESTITNAGGYYNLTAVPGNDTVLISTGKYNKVFDSGSNAIQYIHFHVSQQQAERQSLGYNQTTGLPSYYITENYQLKSTKVSGTLSFSYLTNPGSKKGGSAKSFSIPISRGSVTFYNTTNKVSFTSSLENGLYVLNNIPAYTYLINATVGGNTYHNIANFTLTQGAVVQENLNIQYDSVFARALLNGNPIKGANIVLNGSGITKTNVTNSTGVSEFWVQPGSYSLYLSGQGITSAFVQASFKSWNLNQTLNLTPSASARITGSVTQMNSPVYVYFYQSGQENEARQAITNSQGDFNISLPLGIYTAYVHRGNQVAFKTFDLNANMNLTLSLSSGSYINLTTYLPTSVQYTGYYEVLSGSGIIQVDYNTPTSLTSIYVPRGTYTIQSHGVSLGKIYSAEKITYVKASLAINMSLQPAVMLNVSMYSTNSAKSSLLDNGILEMSYQGTPLTFQSVPKSGFVALDIPLAYVHDSLLSVSYKSPYFLPITKSVSSRNLTMNAEVIAFTLSGAINLYGKQSAYNGTVYLDGPGGNYTLPLSDGSFTGVVPAGEYMVKFSSLDASIAPETQLVSIPASNVSITIPVKSFVRLQENGSLNYTLFSSAGESYHGSSEVPAGVYTVYSVNPIGTNITRLYIGKNTTFSPSFGKSYYVALENTLSVKGGNYSLDYKGLVVHFSEGTYSLPAGNYGVSYLLNYSNSTGQYSLSGSKHVSLASDTTINLTLSVSTIHDILYGLVLYNGKPYQYTNVSVFNSTGAFVKQAYTNGTGWYRMNLSAGTYSLYVTNVASGLAFVGSETLNPFSAPTIYNVTMIPGTTVPVSVTISGKVINTNITIIHTSFTMVINSSQKSIFLPMESFEFSASEKFNSTYQGIQFTEIYGTNVTQAITYGSYVLVQLERIYHYNLALGQLSGPSGSVLNGSTAAYTFYLKNAGHTFANVTLHSGNGSWNITFSKYKLMLSPGQNVTMNASVIISKYAASGKDKIPVRVNYGTGNYTGYLTATVKQFYNFSMTSVNTVGVPHEKNILIKFSVKNTGNGPEKVALSINRSLYSSYGWSFSFIYNNKSVTKVSLSMNQTASLYLELSPNSSMKQRYITSVTILGTLNGQVKSLSLVPQYPQLPVLKTYPVGESISNYTGNPYDTLYIGIGIIAASIIAGLAIAGFRGRRKK